MCRKFFYGTFKYIHIPTYIYIVLTYVSRFFTNYLSIAITAVAKEQKNFFELKVQNTARATTTTSILIYISKYITGPQTAP